MKTLITLTAVLAALVGCATKPTESQSYAIVLTTKADIADAGTAAVIPGFISQHDCEAAMSKESAGAMTQHGNAGIISARCALVKT